MSWRPVYGCLGDWVTHSIKLYWTTKANRRLKLFVVYFDQLLGAACNQNLVGILFLPIWMSSRGKSQFLSFISSFLPILGPHFGPPFWVDFSFYMNKVYIWWESNKSEQVVISHSNSNKCQPVNLGGFLCSNFYKFVTTNTFNFHGTIA